jgi:1,2-phenylacetyl-CoA epoxidase catalytic subunit
MRKYGHIAPNSYKRLWGSWSNFLKEQGENYQRRNIPNEELMKAYLKLKKQLNKTCLTQKDMNLYGEFSSSVYERRFGSWNKFLNCIGDKRT